MIHRAGGGWVILSAQWLVFWYLYKPQANVDIATPLAFCDGSFVLEEILQAYESPQGLLDVTCILARMDQHMFRYLHFNQGYWEGKAVFTRDGVIPLTSVDW